MSNRISSDSNARAELAEQYLAQKAERDKLRDDHEREMKNLKGSFNSEKGHLEDRFETSLQTDKIRHYEHLRNLKNEINREARRIEQAKTNIIGQKNHELIRAEVETQREGTARLQELQRKFVAAQEYELARENQAIEEVRGDHRRNADLILQDSQKKITDMRTEKETMLENQKTNHSKALIDIQKHYENLRTDTQKNYTADFNKVRQKTQDDLDQERLNNAAWLEKYSNRQKDPFYKMTRFNSDLTDAGDAYILKVKVPEYERGQFRVQLSGQEVQLTGVRTNNDKVEIEPGRWAETQSFQNMSEKFVLDSPFDGRAMTMETKGDWLVYQIPKYGPNHRMREALIDQKITKKDQETVKEVEFPKSLPKPTVRKPTQT